MWRKEHQGAENRNYWYFAQVPSTTFNFALVRLPMGNPVISYLVQLEKSYKPVFCFVDLLRPVRRKSRMSYGIRLPILIHMYIWRGIT